MINWRGIGICAFYYMLNLFGVVVLHRSMVNWRRGVNLPWVYMHYTVYETYLDECQDDPNIQCNGVL